MKKTSMQSLINKYDFFLFDQWGVLHDGDKLYKFTNNTLKTIKNKKLFLISNTSQTISEFKSQTLKKINLKFVYFKNIITAGESLYKTVKKNKKNIISKIISKKKAFIISNGNEKNLIKKLKIKEVNYNSSKFILSLSLKPKENTIKIMKNLKILAQRKIPMICTNPDMYTFFKGNRYFQIGHVANSYQKLGGKVHYIGKPYKDIFSSLINKLIKKKTLIIGDNLKTDILGGKNFGIKTALALNGFKKLNQIKTNKLAIKHILKNKIIPNYIIKDISIS